MKPNKVIVADDHELIRSGMAGILAAEFPGCIVREATSAQEVFNYLKSEDDFDLALVDLLLGDMDPFIFLRRLCNQHPELPVVVVSASDSSIHIRKALEIGVVGYVPKAASKDVLGKALRLVVSGGTYVPSSEVVSSKTASYDDSDIAIKTATMESVQELLTTRQMEILKMLAQGKSNKQIGHNLGLSYNTVRVHVSAVLKALELSNRAQAGIFAEKIGLC